MLNWIYNSNNTVVILNIKLWYNIYDGVNNISSTISLEWARRVGVHRVYGTVCSAVSIELDTDHSWSISCTQVHKIYLGFIPIEL